MEEGFVNEMSFKPGVKGWGSDRWWERRWWLWWGKHLPWWQHYQYWHWYYYQLGQVPDRTRRLDLLLHWNTTCTSELSVIMLLYCYCT